MEYQIREHYIRFNRPGEGFPVDTLPEETVQAFKDAMKVFPLGKLLYLPCATVEEETLWYDYKRNAFYSASIDQILDKHAETLNALWRSQQREENRRRYYQYKSILAERRSS